MIAKPGVSQLPRRGHRQQRTRRGKILRHRRIGVRLAHIQCQGQRSFFRHADLLAHQPAHCRLDRHGARGIGGRGQFGQQPGRAFIAIVLQRPDRQALGARLLYSGCRRPSSPPARSTGRGWRAGVARIFRTGVPARRDLFFQRDGRCRRRAPRPCPRPPAGHAPWAPASPVRWRAWPEPRPAIEEDVSWHCPITPWRAIRQRRQIAPGAAKSIYLKGKYANNGR